MVFMLLVWIGHCGALSSNIQWLLVGIIHAENAHCLVALPAEREYVGEVLVGRCRFFLTHSFPNHFIGLVRVFRCV